METFKFKTNIKCSGCIAKATPTLDEVIGKDKWNVDVVNPDKILTVEGGNDLQPADIIHAVEEAGFKAEKVDN